MVSVVTAFEPDQLYQLRSAWAGRSPEYWVVSELDGLDMGVEPDDVPEDDPDAAPGVCVLVSGVAGVVLWLCVAGAIGDSAGAVD